MIRQHSLVQVVIEHWLLIANVVAATFLLMPFSAPVFMHFGHRELANAIYSAYSVTCHEWPFRSYFIFGPQAIYSAAELQSWGVASLFDFRGSPGYCTPAIGHSCRHSLYLAIAF
jgi:hypothetical protein